MAGESHDFIGVIGKSCHRVMNSIYVNSVSVGGIQVDRTSCLGWSNHVQPFFHCFWVGQLKRCTLVMIIFVFGWHPPNSTL